MKIFFDVDGVLIDGWHSKAARRKPWDAAIEHDLGVDREAFRKCFFESPSGTFASPMHACVRGERDLKEALADVLPGVGYRGSVEAFVRYWFEKDSNVNHEVLDAVKRLGRRSNAELYLATGQEHYRAAYLWNDLGFNEHFKDIFYSAKLGHLKGSGAFFAEINRVLRIAPGELPLFFDDQEDVVAVARASGWDACLFDTSEDILMHPRLRSLLRE